MTNACHDQYGANAALSCGSPSRRCLFDQNTPTPTAHTYTKHKHAHIRLHVCLSQVALGLKSLVPRLAEDAPGFHPIVVHVLARSFHPCQAMQSAVDAASARGIQVKQHGGPPYLTIVA